MPKGQDATWQRRILHSSIERWSDRPGGAKPTNGCPMAIEVLDGDTADPMITQARITEGIRSAGLDWITALRCEFQLHPQDHRDRRRSGDRRHLCPAHQSARRDLRRCDNRAQLQIPRLGRAGIPGVPKPSSCRAPLPPTTELPLDCGRASRVRLPLTTGLGRGQ
jgi:hypothetical protein